MKEVCARTVRNRSLYLLACGAMLLGAGQAAATLPRHGQDQLQPTYRETTRFQVFDRGGESLPTFEFNILHNPTFSESRFRRSWGVGGGMEWYMARPLGLRLGLDYESIETRGGLDDATAVSLGGGFLWELYRTPTLRLQGFAGLNYVFLDYDEAGDSFDDGITGRLGLEFIYGTGTGFGVGGGIGYRFDLDKSKNSAGDSLSLDALMLQLKFVFAF